MKVLLVSPQPPPYGGIANWSKMILEYASHTEDVLRTINIAPKKRSTEGRNLFDRVFVSGIEMFAKRRELKKEIKNNRPDVIHMTTSGSLAIIRDILLLKTAKNTVCPRYIIFVLVKQMKWLRIIRECGHSLKRLCYLQAR